MITVNRMFIDVLEWGVVFTIVLLAFASALYVLYRSQAAGIGLFWDELHGEKCENLDNYLGSWVNSIVFLWEVVLTGNAHLPCFHQSSPRRNMLGTALQYTFLTYSVILMLNFLVYKGTRACSGPRRKGCACDVCMSVCLSGCARQVALMGQTFSEVHERSDQMWKMLYASL